MSPSSSGSDLPDALSRLRRAPGDASAPVDAPAPPPPAEPPAASTAPRAAELPVAEPAPAKPASGTSASGTSASGTSASGTSATAPVAKSGSWRPTGGDGRVVVAVLALLAVAAAAVVAVGTQRLADRHRSHARQSAVAGARGPIVAAATSEVESALSYDYRHLSQDFANAEQGLTPSYRAAYGRFTGQDVVANAQKYHAVTTAAVEGAGVISNTTSTATLLVFINQTSTNSLLKSPRLDRSSARITMQKLHGKWLLNGLNTV